MISQVVQQGSNLVTTQGVKVAPGTVAAAAGAAPTTPTGQTAIIGGQTVRLATSPAGGGTLLKTGTAIASPGGKQIILQKQGLGAGGSGQPQIVTLVKTSQGMQVATVPKASIVQQGAKPAGGAGAPQQILQTTAGKTIPPGATFVKLLNAPGGAGGQAAKIVTNVKTLGSNVMTVAKPAGGTVQMAGGAAAGKQTFVINKPGTTLKGPGGQQIIVVSSAGGLKTVQAMTSTQAGAGAGVATSTVLPSGSVVSSAAGTGQPGAVKMIVVSSSQIGGGTSTRPITITMPGQGGGAAKTVTLATSSGLKTSSGAAQLLNTSTGQILAMPAGAAGTQSVNIGGKQVNVQMASQGAAGSGKTLTLVQTGSGTQQLVSTAGAAGTEGQKMIVVQAVS